MEKTTILSFSNFFKNNYDLQVFFSFHFYLTSILQIYISVICMSNNFFSKLKNKAVVGVGFFSLLNTVFTRLLDGLFYPKTASKNPPASYARDAGAKSIKITRNNSGANPKSTVAGCRTPIAERRATQRRQAELRTRHSNVNTSQCADVSVQYNLLNICPQT